MKRLVLAVLLSLPAAGAWGMKHSVRVSFDIDPHHEYRDSHGGYTGAKLDRIRHDVAIAARNALEKKIGFVTFTNGAADNTLTITLDDKEKGVASGLREVVFRFGFSTPDETAEPVDMTFRPPGHATDPIQPIDGFITELTLKLEGHIERSYNDLVSRQLTLLKIADRAKPFPSDLLFVLPLKAADLDIGENTLFMIKATIPRPAGDVPRTYIARTAGEGADTLSPPFKRALKIEAEQPPNLMDELKRAATVTITGVFVNFYVKPHGQTPRPPSSLSLGN